MPASVWRNIVALFVVFSTLVAAIDENYDIEVKVVKPKKSLKKIISSYSTNTICHHLPNGLDRMKRGVDVAYLDMLPRDTSTDMGYRAPIFDYTCNEGKKVFLDNKEFDLPDQISGAEQVPGGFKSKKVEVFKKMSQVSDSMKFSLGIGDALGLFTLSPSFSYAHKTLTNTSRYLEEVRAHVSAYRADHAPEWVLELTKYAKMYLDKRLTKPFTEAPHLYETFIKTFGTHFFQNAFFGGMLKLDIETERSYFEDSTIFQIGLEAGGTFGQAVKLKGGIDVGNTNVDIRFKAASQETMRYYGGELNLLNEGGIKEWTPTIIGNPWLFRGNLVPIYEIMEYEAKKKEMKMAVQVHLDKAYLQFLKKNIQSVVAAHGATADTNEWMNMIDQESAKLIPDNNRLRTMGKDIEYHLIVPSWFKDNVQLCFEWAPTTGPLHNPKQCGGNQPGLPRKLCAKVGKFTEDYLDKTDLSFGGCYYSWRLELIGNPQEQIPQYFRETAICHGWRVQGLGSPWEADAGQCNSGKKYGYNCAPVGQSTTRYLDDTNFRRGGCEYSWVIYAPGNAPMWLKNLQLCFKWQATGEAKRCGKNGVPPSVCTKSNQWMWPYNDDSTVGGGCMMSWGLNIKN